jgi:hypothetical protein
MPKPKKEPGADGDGAPLAPKADPMSHVHPPTTHSAPSNMPAGESMKQDDNISALKQALLDPEVVRTMLKARGIKSTHEPLDRSLMKPALTSKQTFVKGRVRATPYGANMENYYSSETTKHTQSKQKYPFPPEGFDHIYGPSLIAESERLNSDQDEDTAEAMDAYTSVLKASADGFAKDGEAEVDGNEYGSCRTTLDSPVGSLKEKWRLLPYFLQLRSLMRQHIDSFDYFVNVDMRMIVQSPSAREVRSDHDPKFYLQYTDCWVGEPEVEEDAYDSTQATPFQCRLRDCTYSAPIYVNVRYTRGRQIVVKKKVSNIMMGSYLLRSRLK